MHISSHLSGWSALQVVWIVYAGELNIVVIELECSIVEQTTIVEFGFLFRPPQRASSKTLEPSSCPHRCTNGSTGKVLLTRHRSGPAPREEQRVVADHAGTRRNAGPLGWSLLTPALATRVKERL